jgi:hypothetical protein
MDRQGVLEDGEDSVNDEERTDELVDDPVPQLKPDPDVEEDDMPRIMSDEEIEQLPAHGSIPSEEEGR